MENERQERLKRLSYLKKAGQNPYPSKSGKRQPIDKVLGKFAVWQKQQKRINIIGRVMALRSHGGSTFVNIADQTGTLQVFLKKDILKERYSLFQKTADRGDFIEASGTLFKTKTDVQTLLVQNWTMLTKALRPLPAKWHGLVNIEIRYRQRYLDLIANPEVKNIFLKRNLMIKAIRNYFDKHGFIEVETPILQSQYGGAYARPFITHHNALNRDFYLRIAPELYLKRLLVGGFEKVYEIGRQFRNEGIDYAHNPEFTLLEFYWAYTDYRQQMDFTEKLLVEVIKKVCGNLKVSFGKHTLNFEAPLQRLSYHGLMKKYLDFDVLTADKTLLNKISRRNGFKTEKGWSEAKIIDELFKTFVRPKLIQPTIVMDYPALLKPLAKQSSKNRNVAEAFQIILAGEFELNNSYTEQNDPLSQRKQMEIHQKFKDKGDLESTPIDDEYLTALEYGMPPASGNGIGLDRLLSILVNKHNLREVIIFPTLKSKKE